MQLVLETLISGLVLGSVYAVLGGGLTLGYRATGIVNFGYAAIAFFVARLYYYMCVQHAWNHALAGAICVLVVAPGLGVLLWAVLFRHLKLASQLVRVCVTIGVSVCLNAISYLVFGTAQTPAAAGLGPEHSPSYHLTGAVNVTLDQLICYAAAVLILGGGAAVLRWTDAGILVRATVDSEAQASLSGIRTPRVAAGVWAATTLIAGLAGILIAPVVGLDETAFTALQAAAFATIVAGRLRNLNVAIVVGVLMGVATAAAQVYIPATSSQLVDDALPSIPFIFLLVFLVYFAVRRVSLEGSASVGGVLDRAIQPVGGITDIHGPNAAASPRAWIPRRLIPGVFFLLLVLLPLILGGQWALTLGLGLAYAVIFLSYTLTAGAGGMIWLCQITFGGIGAFSAAALATNDHWPALVALLAGGILAALVGTAVGVLTARMGNLSVALVTISFGLLVENVVFQWNALNHFGAGIVFNAPQFALAPRGFAWFALAVFAIVALLYANLRRSTFGLVVAAVRWGPQGARATGLNVTATKVAVAAGGAFIAGIGGALIAMESGAANPADYPTAQGLVWVAVLVSLGITTPTAALFAGLMFGFSNTVFATYLPISLGNLIPALFGLGAVMLVHNPDGGLAQQRRGLEKLLGHRERGSSDGSRAEVVGDLRQDPMATSSDTDSVQTVEHA